MVLSETEPDNPSESFDDNGPQSAMDTYGYEAELTPAARQIFRDVTHAWTQILPTPATSTELAALADVCKDSVRDGKVGAAAGLLLFATAPFTVPPLRRFMNALPDNMFSARYAQGSRANVWLRRMPVLLPAVVVGQFAMFTVASVAFKTSLAMRVMSDPRLSRPNQAMEEWGEKFQKERIRAMRAGEKPPTSLTELMNRQKQQAQAQAQRQRQIPAGVEQRDAEQAAARDWTNSQSMPDSGSMSSMTDSRDSEFGVKSLDGSNYSPPWDSRSDNSSTLDPWESTFDDDDDASPVARSHKAQERRQDRQSQQPMSWDEIRRRATSSDSPASGSTSSFRTGNRRQQQVNKDDAQQDFDARLEKEREGQDFDGERRGRRGW